MFKFNFLKFRKKRKIIPKFKVGILKSKVKVSQATKGKSYKV